MKDKRKTIYVKNVPYRWVRSYAALPAPGHVCPAGPHTAAQGWPDPNPSVSAPSAIICALDFVPWIHVCLPGDH